MLKPIRIFVAVLSFLAVTFLFLDFTGTARHFWPWMAKIQLMPAILSGYTLAVLSIIVATLLFGRLYCSVICPLGIFQDIVGWVRGHVGKKKKRKFRFKFAPANTKTRLVILTLFALLIIAGMFHALAAAIAGLIEPYSAYGRIATEIFSPAYDGVNNLLAAWSERQEDNYMFYRVVSAVSIPVLAVAIVTLVAIVLFAWRGGRDYCNTICPVGTFLGLLSKYSLFKPVIDMSKCVNCGKCGRRCKSSCIDTKNHRIDYSRCVVCFDCISECKEGAIKYTLRKPFSDTKEEGSNAIDKGRRGFVSGAGFLIGAVTMDALAKTTDGGLTPLKDKQPIKRSTRIVPPGAISISNVKKQCTACQLCISSCPNHILKPTLSVDGFMQPHLDFTEGYCTPGCTTCSDICPVGAIRPIDVASKSSIKIGSAVVDLDSCIAAKGKRCGNCASRCPSNAIIMVQLDESVPESPRVPVVSESACIGCGACEYHCPVGTVEGIDGDHSAIHVEGVEVHRFI